jgi:aromatic-L-amino-acid decarboxylase
MVTKKTGGSAWNIAPGCTTVICLEYCFVSFGLSVTISLHREKTLADEKSFHMTPDQFRRHGHAVVDWIADYYGKIESFPVLARVGPGDIRASLPPAAPVQGESFEAILADIDQLILPGITHWQSPNFFAYFPSNASGPSILGDLLSSGLDVQGMLWATSPACTELETHVLDWLVPMLGLPEKFLSTSTGGGVIQDTASSASLCALLAGRERATHYASNRTGCDGKLVAYCSTQTHSSVEKAARIAGLGAANLRAIAVDENFAMRPDGLARQIAQDRAEGLVPCFVCATVGTTSSNAIDPVPAIGRICRQHGIWLHVDAAMSGTAALCPEFRHLHNGVEFADSYCFNPHKWMFTNFDCDVFYVADRKALLETLSVLPEYLRNQATESGAVIDYRDWQIPLGRRFRALKLWFVLRHYGSEGLQHHVRRHVALAQRLAEWVRNDDRFELAAPVPLNLVCFRHKAGDTANQALMDRLNRSGALYLTHTRLNDRFTLRLCVGQTNTEARHLEQAWKKIQAECSSLGAS